MGMSCFSILTGVGFFCALLQYFCKQIRNADIMKFGCLSSFRMFIFMFRYKRETDGHIILLIAVLKIAVKANFRFDMSQANYYNVIGHNYEHALIFSYMRWSVIMKLIHLSFHSLYTKPVSIKIANTSILKCSVRFCT